MSLILGLLGIAIIGTLTGLAAVHVANVWSDHD